MHLPSALHLVFADDGDVVLALTGDHARRTPHAGVQINGHPPLVMRLLFLFLQWVRIKRPHPARRLVYVQALGKPGIFLKLLQIGFAHNRASLHGPVILGAGKRVCFPRRSHRRADREVRRLPGTQRIRIESHPIAHPPRAFASVTQREAERIIRHAGLNPNRTLHRTSVERNFDHLAILYAEFTRGLAAEEHRVVPNHLGDGIRQFLQPTVVRIAAIIEAVVAMENDFEPLL
ncbi:MAG: hypothetical protein BWX84_02028 [Verrucomicrobia bacterium ADurb.Bin118]|nr:MAG: hypothetical protein BWX84_02028 [Verrucomicrobia bacterium ADurb.Bin118]